MSLSNTTVGNILFLRWVFQIIVVLNHKIIEYFSVHLILFLGTDDCTSVHFISHATYESLGIDF